MVTRIYDEDECDAEGVPLDWERCRGLDEPDLGMGSLHEAYRQRGEACPFCAGYGSLKAAALARVRMEAFRRSHADENYTAGEWERMRHAHRVSQVRCEDCGHPRGEETWEGRGNPFDDRAWINMAYVTLRIGCVPGTLGEMMPKPYADSSLYKGHRRVHYSPCDEKCDDHRENGPGRWRYTDEAAWYDLPVPTGLDADDPTGHVLREASWRPVDVRCLSWPHDLRPEKLAILCLRCWATRKSGVRT